jgi:hypothetical protein
MAENKGIAQRKLSFAEDDVPFDIQKRTSYATYFYFLLFNKNILAKKKISKI